MFKESGIQLKELEDSNYDEIAGYGSGAGTIFGTSGGVMEAALRTVYEVATKKELPKIDFEELRGHKGIKTASVALDGVKVP